MAEVEHHLHIGDAIVKPDADLVWEQSTNDSQSDGERQNESIIQEALQQYTQCFGAREQEQNLGFNRKQFPFSTQSAGKPAEPSSLESSSEIKSTLSEAQKKALLGQTATAKTANKFGFEEDSDGEDVYLCKVCSLPVGELCYNKRESCGSRSYLHGECMAQRFSVDLRKEEETRQQKDNVAKKAQHDAYGIGWEARHIPRNEVAASKLAMRDVPQGMVCLVLDEESRSIRLGATYDPAMAVNLQYLSTALQVRRIEGHEPVFSLDPVAQNEETSMQEKVFFPEWLAGTEAGEVLFQSDYHLKELSMGQYEQPVVGMRSCFDFAGPDDDFQEWSGREWFMVRKAEVHITDGNVLIPFVKMGVEAREQVKNGDSWDDKLITRPDHPLVKYAESFTRNFELIAERKSVIYHLRELAKTSIIAKFLLDAGVEMDEAWFHVWQEESIACSLEVPQLWNRRNNSEVVIKENAINTGKSISHCVYGGVQFGLDKFNLSTGVARTAPLSVGQASASVTSLSQKLPGVSRTGTLVANLPTSTALAALPKGVGRRDATSFAASLLGTSVSARAPSIGLSSGIISAMQPGGDLPGLTISPGFKPPKPLLTGSLLGKRVSPVAQPQRLHFGLRPQGLAPITMTQPSFPGALLPKAQLLNPSVVNPPVGSAVPPPPRLSAIAGVPRLTAALQAAAIAPNFQRSPINEPALQSSLQGVDLRLDSFDLSSAKRVSLEAHEGSWGHEAKPLDECVVVADAFWRGLEDDAEAFKEEDRALLKDIFNPELCDRRMEGDLFTPPDASHAYVTKLRTLVKDEKDVRVQRKAHFFDKSFSTSQPSELFPHSWRVGFDIASGIMAAEERPHGTLQERPELRRQAGDLLLEVMKSCAPVFDKSTEEGCRYRIYQMGSLEIRSVQELDGTEQVGAVFSVRVPTVTGGRKGERIRDSARITKATEYVERVWNGDAKSRWRYYLVLETKNGQKIVTERLRNGSVTWLEDPEDLGDRNSLARATRSKDAIDNLTVRDMKAYYNALEADARAVTVSPSVCKRYVRNLYSRAVNAPLEMAAVVQQPARSARIATEARKSGRPPRWTDITMAA